MGSEWPTNPLDSLCELIVDCPHSTPMWTTNGVIVLRSQNIRGGRLDLSSTSYTDEEHYQDRIRRAEPTAGDLVITREAPMGEVCQIPIGLRCCLGQRMVLLRPDLSLINSRYLLYALQSRAVQSQIMWSEGTGSTVSNLRIPDLKKLKIPSPPLPEQRAIAHILGTLDDKIELNRKRNETLEAMARALFKDWFVDFGPVRARMEGRDPYLPAEIWDLFPDKLDDEGKPEGWGKRPLSEVLTIIGGGTPKTSVEDYWGGDIPWFSVVDTPSASNVFVVSTEKTITARGLAYSSARLIPKGTTIISARGTVGNLAIAGRDMTFNQSCYGIRGIGSAGDYFIYLTMQQMVDQLKSMAHGSVFSTITRQTFEAIHRPFPIASLLIAFEVIVESWFDKILNNVYESQTLAQLRDTLLPKLISGELRVGDVDGFLDGVIQGGVS